MNNFFFASFTCTIIDTRLGVSATVAVGRCSFTAMPRFNRKLVSGFPSITKRRITLTDIERSEQDVSQGIHFDL